MVLYTVLTSILGVETLIVGELLLIPAAIMAAIAAIFLLGEDLYTYFQGGDSVFGALIETLGTAMSWVTEKIAGIVTGAITFMTEKIKEIYNHPAKLIKLLASAPLLALGPAGFAAAAYINKDIFSSSGASTTPEAYAASKSNPLSMGGNSQYQVTAPITVTVPPGTDPSQVAGAAQEGIVNGLWDVFDQAQRSTSPGVK